MPGPSFVQHIPTSGQPHSHVAKAQRRRACSPRQIRARPICAGAYPVRFQTQARQHTPIHSCKTPSVRGHWKHKVGSEPTIVRPCARPPTTQKFGKKTYTRAIRMSMSGSCSSSRHAVMGSDSSMSLRDACSRNQTKSACTHTTG